MVNWWSIDPILDKICCSSHGNKIWDPPPARDPPPRFQASSLYPTEYSHSSWNDRLDRTTVHCGGELGPKGVPLLLQTLSNRWCVWGTEASPASWDAQTADQIYMHMHATDHCVHVHTMHCLCSTVIASTSEASFPTQNHFCRRMDLNYACPVRFGMRFSEQISDFCSS
jgi:hypothetical protein